MKRTLDLIFSIVSLLILSPIILITALLCRVNFGDPIFSQSRPGLNGEVFRLYKFRTMSDEKDKSGKLLPDNERLTPFGETLRSTSLDELPSLLNVLRGQMSLVGPRPLHVEYLSLYSTEQSRRHDVLPGITGWAQVNGRNAISWEDKFELDIWYVDNTSIWLDLKILFLTVKKVLYREGVSAEDEATMSRFTGSG